ncbi:aspartate aminotransferase family protein [Arenibaculum pallidiluteum]|uniref:aspartate aminotransferase family protein n=1 Tax=Arenibaculum pallidiluteum TaxID=2812559 RepID=UPI001A97CF2A|nr:aspartate aminotransferase family protein [Arenibaculum pallidiluteum]
MPTYARADVAFERGEGPYLFDDKGKRYLDFMSGIAVNGLGHCHPRLVEALTAQARRIWHVSNVFRVPGQEKVARRLVENTFADTVFFTNSGVEAWECGAKLVRKYHDETGNPQRWRIITFNQAFHGRTMTAISAAKQEKLVKGFYPLVEGFDQVAFGNLNELRAAITDETAAICVEPVQGEGGVRSGDADFMRALRQVCDEFGLLLFLDEIQTGMGRTGKLFAHEWAGITPDVMCIAKGIGGGFPVGACLATEKAAVGMTAGTHGTTFGGNPLAMAVADAVLDVILEPGFLDRVDAVARRLRARLEALAAKHRSVLTEVRGMGLLLGLRIRDGIANTDVIAALRDAGLVTVGAGDNVIRLLPPLIIGDAEIEEGCAILDRVLSETRAS